MQLIAPVFSQKVNAFKNVNFQANQSRRAFLGAALAAPLAIAATLVSPSTAEASESAYKNSQSHRIQIQQNKRWNTGNQRHEAVFLTRPEGITQSIPIYVPQDYDCRSGNYSVGNTQYPYITWYPSGKPYNRQWAFFHSHPGHKLSRH